MRAQAGHTECGTAARRAGIVRPVDRDAVPADARSRTEEQ